MVRFLAALLFALPPAAYAGGANKVTGASGAQGTSPVVAPVPELTQPLSSLAPVESPTPLATSQGTPVLLPVMEAAPAAGVAAVPLLPGIIGDRHADGVPPSGVAGEQLRQGDDEAAAPRTVHEQAKAVAENTSQLQEGGGSGGGAALHFDTPKSGAPAVEGGGPGPTTPDTVVAYLKTIAPEAQSIANRVLEMDPSKPQTCAACGSVSFGAQEPLQRALRRHFQRDDIEVLLEPGRLDGPGEPVPHVLLKVVLRTGGIFVEPLAIIDLTGAQKPENMTAAGFDPHETLILPWRQGGAGPYGTYAFTPLALGDKPAAVQRTVRAVDQYGSRARQLRGELDRALNSPD